ncbi:MAG: zinc ribbon domain-containing protein [Candidatus Ranarchaeia archaeon]
MQEKRYCPNCGTRVPPNARFCDQCGSPLSDVVTSKPQKAPDIQNVPPVFAPSAEAGFSTQEYTPPLTQPSPYLDTPKTPKIKAKAVVNASISIYAGNFAKFFLLMAPFMLVGKLGEYMVGFLHDFLINMMLGDVIDLSIYLLTLTLDERLVTFLLINITMIMLSSIVTIFFSSLAGSMIIGAVVNAYHGVPVDINNSFKAAKEHFRDLLFGAIIFSVGVTLGLILFLFPGIYMITIWAVWQQSILLENRRGGESLSRSSQITHHNRGKIFLVILFLQVISLVVSALAQLFIPGIILSVGPGILVDTIDLLLTLLLAPLTPVAGTIIYMALAEAQVYPKQPTEATFSQY